MVRFSSDEGAESEVKPYEIWREGRRFDVRAEDKAGDEREEEAAYVNKNLSNDLHIFLP